MLRGVKVKKLIVFVCLMLLTACVSQNVKICYDKHVDQMTEREFDFCKSWVNKMEISTSSYTYSY